MRRSAAPSMLRGGAAAPPVGAGTPVAALGAAAPPVEAAAATREDAENVNSEASTKETPASTAAAPAAAPPLQQLQQQRAFAAPGLLLKRKALDPPSAATATTTTTASTAAAAAAAASSSASAASASASASGQTQVYRVLFCKRSSKKRINKSFSDAILEVRGESSIALYDDEGKRFAAGKMQGARDMPEGSEGECAQYEFEVCERADAAAFASGALFLKPVPVGLSSGGAGGGGSGGGTTPTTTTTGVATTATTLAGSWRQGGAFRAPLGARKGLSSSSNAAAAAAAAAAAPRALPPPLFDPAAPGAIVLNEAEAEAGGQVAVVVDPFLARKLRQHQVEAVRWLYDRLALPPISPSSSFGGVGAISAAAASAAAAANRAGCILSHEPGLGKTLTSLALVHTLLRQSPRGFFSGGGAPGGAGGGGAGGHGHRGLIRRVAVACPASLCDNWAAEVQKWLGGERLRCLVLRGSSGAEAASDVGAFRAGSATPLLIASYETLRAAAPALAGSVDLLICDEGHRLKAAGGSRTQAALLSLRCPRMLLITGTPLQNDLGELFALVDFARPGSLGSLGLFRTLFEAPIQRSRDARASDREREVGQLRAAELAARVGAVVLRRSAAVNAAYLPPLTVYDVFLRLTDAQVAAYRAVLGGSGVASVLRGGGGGGNGGGGGAGTTTVLPLIGLLRKICISPKLVRSSSTTSARGGVDDDDEEEEDVKAAAPAKGGGGGDNEPSPRAASAAAAAAAWRDSAKLVALDALLRAAAARGDKVIVTSTSTAVLDVAGLVARAAGMTTARIDGATDARGRIDVVNAFNNASSSSVPGSRGGDVMLLSMRAGGAGLNLVGAPVLVTLDFDWNPATIAQAEARHWRSGQTKPCAVYRLIAAGSIDEKMLQRVLSKRDLAGALKAGGAGGAGKAAAGSKKSSAFSRDELRELFSLDVRTRCGTRDIMLKKDRVNYGGGGGKRRRGGGSGNEDDDDDDDATKGWRQTAAACAPGDAEAGAPEILAGDGQGLADGRTQLLAAVLATGRVSWVHEEDGKASATEEERGGEEEEATGGAGEEEEEVTEEEEGGGEQLVGGGGEEEEALPADDDDDDSAAVPAQLPDVDAAPAGRAAVDDESILEVFE